MKYYINGDEVTEDKFETDRNDNFNCGITFHLIELDGETHMDY